MEGERRGTRAEGLRDVLPASRGPAVRRLADLPEGQRTVIALHHLLDLPVQQVADELGIPTGTVKARLSRGRAALANRLRGRDEEHHVR